MTRERHVDIRSGGCGVASERHGDAGNGRHGRRHRVGRNLAPTSAVFFTLVANVFFTVLQLLWTKKLLDGVAELFAGGGEKETARAEETKKKK